MSATPFLYGCTTQLSYGQGQGLTLRDARVLHDQLLAHDDWHAAPDSMLPNMTAILLGSTRLPIGFTNCFMRPDPMPTRAELARCRCWRRI
jgi:hypothetical protein